MSEPNTDCDREVFTTSTSKPLQNIKSIEQSLMIMRRKLSQMNKRETENVQEIEKVFYSSIPILNKKLTQSIEEQKFLQKKKINFHENILKEKTLKNKEKKMINEMEIERNKELISMMKINERNAIKELSKKNELHIEKMKQKHIENNRQKRELVKSRMEHSRMKVQDFRISKVEDIKRQKEEDNIMLERKKQNMLKEMNTLVDKENVIVQNVSKSEEMLMELRFAIDKMQKMSEIEFIKIRNQVKLEEPSLADDKLFERILVEIIQAEKMKNPIKYGTKSLYQSRSKYSSAGQLVPKLM